MQDLEAVRLALYLFHLPTAVRGARDKPLPGGIAPLLEVAAGEEGAVETAAARLERPVDVVHQACAFFIEQIMLAPEADAYRVLGARREASDIELRRNMALMLRWVHPDLDRAGERSVYAGRVTRAWEALKTQERRAAYDAANPPRAASSRSGGHSRQRSSMSRLPGPGLGGGQQARPVMLHRVPPKPGLIRAALRFILRGRAPN